MLARSRLRCPHVLNHPWRALRSVSVQADNAHINALVSGPPPRIANEGHLSNYRLAVKDNICTSDLPTTCSSKMLENFTSPFDATVVALLKANGAAIVGKANCDEFGMGSLNIHSAHGHVLNPFGLEGRSPSGQLERRSAGGSSGGSAAAVAADMCDAALGTDTGGSVRLPASYCGVVGLKPSYGMISRWGVVSFADSLDCVGILARNVHTARQVHQVLSVYDDKDPTAAKPATRNRAKESCNDHSKWADQKSLSGLRIGVPQEYFPMELQDTVAESVRGILKQLQDRGATIIPVSLPSTPYALSAYYVLSSAEASSNLARYDGIEYGMRVAPPPGADMTKTAHVYAHTRSQGFGKEVQRRILLGTYALSADAFGNYFLQAQRVRQLIKADFDRVFCVPNALSSSNTTHGSTDGVHVLIHPSAIQTAPKLPDMDGLDVSDSVSSLDAYVQDVMTVPASLGGLPALSVPSGKGEDGWPVGVSVVGQWGCDEMVLKVGEVIEALTL